MLSYVYEYHMIVMAWETISSLTSYTLKGSEKGIGI